MFSMSVVTVYASDKMSSGDPILVAAIDFGTTFSRQILPIFICFTMYSMSTVAGYVNDKILS